MNNVWTPKTKQVGIQICNILTDEYNINSFALEFYTEKLYKKSGAYNLLGWIVPLLASKVDPLKVYERICEELDGHGLVSLTTAVEEEMNGKKAN